MGDFQIGRLQAALANATNEVTIAAANVNFDFCLVKYEAPKEYQPLGALLSAKRKQDAESGTSHITARRLAALFQGLCPETPNLIKAYGQRVSEISKTATNKESAHFASSMFASYAGIDATSIWAAATSSQTTKGGALHVHLLASMLAKVWPPPEAVSIWDELVRERRRLIAEELERGDSLPFSLATAAAQQEISRAKLAEWDASARAWVQTADTIMAYQQTQLRLILSNVEMSVDRGPTFYSGVVEAWVKALTVMERLVSGVPQEVHDGAALLGLAAWHIYPDMHIFGARNIEVAMKDDLVKSGGVVTLGCSPSATTPSTGITWSLSLSQLKFYGQPVQSLGSVQSDPARLSFDELMLVTLGCIIRLWDISSEQVPLVTKIISAMVENLERRGENSVLLLGLQHLAKASDEYVRNPDNASVFVNLGINRPKFIPERISLPSVAVLRPLFGCLNDDIFLSWMKGDEARILFLRRLAGRSLGHQSAAPDCVIRYFVHSSARKTRKTPAWASVFATEPLLGSLAPRKSAMSHCRWNAPQSGNSPTEVHYRGTKKDAIRFEDDGIFIVKTHQMKTVKLTHWFGDNDASIYLKQEPSEPAVTAPNIGLEDVLWALENDLLVLDIPNDSASITLQFLADTYNVVFRQLSGAIIQLQTLSRPLFASEWAKNRFQRWQPEPSWAQHADAPGYRLRLTISILSYIISDYNAVMKDVPENVCGVSIGDSIYVPAKLVSDPFQSCDDGAVVRILGNIGRPGFVMFSSVDEPMVASSSNTSWRVVNRNIFDGRHDNAFSTTSMHLAFTNWERSMAESGTKGIQDVQLIRMESVVSIRDAGRWIGDVDIIRALRDERVSNLRPQVACNHKTVDAFDTKMISVESWDELRDSHSGNVVVRAHGNWVARLAIAAFLSQGAQKGDFVLENIIVCPKKVCWKCTEKYRACVYIY